MTSTVLKIEIKDFVASLTINRPERRNALNEELIDALETALADCLENSEVRILCIRGEGEKAFCAGADLASAFQGGSSIQQVNQKYARLLTKFRNFPKPTIACVNGDCLGGGFGLALACDSIIVAEDAKMGTPEVKVGLFPMMISPVILENFPRKYAMNMMLQGWMLPAKELFGPFPEMVEMVTKSEFDGKVEKLLQRFRRAAPLALQHGKEALLAVENLEMNEAISEMASHLNKLIQTEDAKEGMSSFREKRAPVWKAK